MKRFCQKGFTLIELVMVIVIVAIISVVISRVLVQSFQTFQTAQNIYEDDWQGFLALERMKTDIHNVRSAADITTATSSQLTFTDANGSSVQYLLSGTLLTRNGQTLASGIQSFALSYLNASGVTTATPALVRYVGISLTASQGTMSLPFATLIGVRVMP